MNSADTGAGSRTLRSAVPLTANWVMPRVFKQVEASSAGVA